ncbi:MAG: hypothetical protein KDA89_18695, partial [Planctomycetaceae bacterium]|nr:hypothetical protein [Planctomycetaceae bacterium]
MNIRFRYWHHVSSVAAAMTILSAAVPAQAGLIFFDLRDTAAIEPVDEGSFITLTRGGITATLTAMVDGNSGVLNVTGSGFGVNADGGTDDTDTIDDKEGLESIEVTFDTAVTIDEVHLSLLTAAQNDQATLTIAGFPGLALADTGTSADIFTISADNELPAGQKMILAFSSGNGFSFDGFSVSTPVPEPTSAVLAALGVVSLLGCRRKCRQCRNTRCCVEHCS